MHTSEIRWSEAANAVSSVSEGVLEQLLRSEEKYAELIEAYVYAGGTDALFAELLFYGTTGGANVPSTEEEDKAADLRLAMVAVHQLYQCLTNIDVPADDRAAKLRRMS